VQVTQEYTVSSGIWFSGPMWKKSSTLTSCDGATPLKKCFRETCIVRWAIQRRINVGLDENWLAIRWLSRTCTAMDVAGNPNLMQKKSPPNGRTHFGNNPQVVGKFDDAASLVAHVESYTGPLGAGPNDILGPLRAGNRSSEPRMGAVHGPTTGIVWTAPSPSAAG